MEVLGANPCSRPEGVAPQRGRVNYLLGNDPSKWRRNLPTYGKVQYREVYPGIDLLYYGNGGELEYDFLVAPGADPNRISLRFEGAAQVKVIGNGDLVLKTAAGEVRHRKPVVYQEAIGGRREIRSEYVLSPAPEAPDAVQVAFHLGDYDRSRQLVIDPVLAFSTYLGGNSIEEGEPVEAMAVDAAGNVYVTGSTYGSFPLLNPFQQAPYPAWEFWNVFVTKLDPSGALVYSTFLGGDFVDLARDLALHPDGSVVVTGLTQSHDFPVLNAYQPSRAPGLRNPDTFVTRLAPAGNALVFSTHLGGTGEDQGLAVALDAAGRAWIGGSTTSADFPRVQPLQPTMAGASDAFVARFSAEGSALEYSTFLGGGAGEHVAGVAIGPSGRVLIAGSTGSADFPVVNAAQPVPGGQNGADAFAAALAPDGQALDYATYLGGSGDDYGRRIAVDTEGSAYVVGRTESAELPFERSLQGLPAHTGNTVLSKLTAEGRLVYTTRLPGWQGRAVAVDAEGCAWVAGSSGGPTFPHVNPVQQEKNGLAVFVCRVSAAGDRLLFSTLLGGGPYNSKGPGPFEEGARAVAVHPTLGVYLAGGATAINFPVRHSLGGQQGADGFVVRISFDPADAGGRLALSSSRLRFGTIGFARKRMRTLQIRNQGSTPLRGTVGQFDEARVVVHIPPFRVTEGAGDFTLAPGESRRVVVEFYPFRTYSAPPRRQDMHFLRGLVITSSDAEHPVTYVPLEGRSLPPKRRRR